MEFEVIHSSQSGFRLSGVDCNHNASHSPAISFWTSEIRIEKPFWFEQHMFKAFATTMREAYKNLEGEAKLYLEHEPYPILGFKFLPNGHVHVVFEDVVWREVEQRVHIGFISDQTYLAPIMERLAAV